MIHDNKTLENFFGDTGYELVYGESRYEISLEGRPSCSQNCPAGINVKGYVNLIANRRYQEALELIRESNPFPGVCGRVCSHPCEANCQRSETGDALSIKALKRFVSDYEVSREPAEIASITPTYGEKIAVIGAGPAGLTAAVDLTRVGYGVTVFEATGSPGGMMMWGIPEFRLPRSVLHREIGLISSMGVTIDTGTRITHPQALLNEGYSAVIMATGSWQGLHLRVPGDDLPGVEDGLVFLKQVYSRSITEVSGHIVVIGGGDSAVDAARTALRLGADRVTIAYRRTEKEMPASHAEIREAVEEGVELLTLVIPKTIIGSTSVEGIELLRTELGDEDESGRRRPVPIGGSEYVLPCDRIIHSIGATARTRELERSGIQFTPRDTLQAEQDGSTPHEGIFAVGDAVRGPSTIVDVIGDAHVCAAAVHSYLRRKDVEVEWRVEGEEEETEEGEEEWRVEGGEEETEGREKEWGVEGAKAEKIAIPGTTGPRYGLVVKKGTFRPGDRSAIPTLDPEVRRQCFEEVEDGYSELVARKEASRCNTCGPCSECPTCLPGCDSKQVIVEIDSAEFLLKVPCEVSRVVYDNLISEFDPEHFTYQRFDLVSKDHGSHGPTFKLHSLTPYVTPDQCFACGRCESACAYRAIRVGLKRGGGAYSFIDHDVCRSCGRCILVCPSSAISLGRYFDKDRIDDLRDSIDLNDGIAVLACHWSPSSDPFAVELMCSIGISPSLIIQAFALGARGVLVSHCPAGRDHYLPIDFDVESIVDSTKEVLSLAGIEARRVRIAMSKDLSSEIDKFRSHLDTKDLDPFTVLDPDNVPGRIGKAFRHLIRLSHQTAGGTRVNQISLLGHLLRASGLPHTLDMVENIRKIANLLGLEINPATMDDALIAPSGFHEEAIAILPEIILEKLKGTTLHPIPMRIGIHASCAPNDQRFSSAITDIISLIPKAVPVMLEQTGCGGSDWRYLDSYAREKALNVYQSALKLDAEVIIPTSPDCLTHLCACNRPGSWRHSSLEVRDIYSLVLQALTGGEHHG